jgi:hypothetical protein
MGHSWVTRGRTGSCRHTRAMSLDPLCYRALSCWYLRLAVAGLEGGCRVRSFATLLAPDPRNARRLQKWITAARAADLPHVHAFTRGLDMDTQAATAGLTLPHHNGRTEGVNLEPG